MLHRKMTVEQYLESVKGNSYTEITLITYRPNGEVITYCKHGIPEKLVQAVLDNLRVEIALYQIPHSKALSVSQHFSELVIVYESK